MLERLNNQQGQITVFLSAVFLLMLGIAFLIFGGMREYMKSSLIEDSFHLSGEDVLANYDKPLQRRYHVFFMDPREEISLTHDMEGGIENAFSQAGFYGQIQSKIALESSKKLLDDDGKAMLYQMKEWETCLHVQKVPDILKNLLKSTEHKEVIRRSIADCDMSSSDSSEEAKRETKEDGRDQNAEETEEERKTRNQWKEWKKTLSSVLDSGILLYVVEEPSSISNLQMTNLSQLPSRNSWRERLSFNCDEINLTKFSQLKKLCEKGFTFESNRNLLSADAYLIPYIFECFTNYRKQDVKEKHRINYEMEYLIGGKTSDKANLKYVANQLFILRFMSNYAYAVTDQVICEEAEAMALVLTGILGFPQAADAVSLLLIASLSYGESLLEVRALLSGDRVALVKSRENWNLSFINAAYKLKSHARILNVKNGVNYQQYLACLLILHSSNRRLLYRMMDVMQSNITLEEEGFLMKDCISSFRVKGTFSWQPFYRKLMTFGLEQKAPYTMEISQIYAYR